MKCTKSLSRLLGVLAGVAVIAIAASVQAKECDLACNKDSRECIKVGRRAALACKLDCRAASPRDLRTCMRSCIDTYLAKKDECRASREDCRDACNPPHPTPCPATCGKALGECMHGEAGAHQSCLRGCASAEDRSACVRGCSQTHQAGSDGCRTEFRSCLDGCAGSPSGAFID